MGKGLVAVGGGFFGLALVPRPDKWVSLNDLPSTIIFHAYSGTGDDAGRVPWGKETEIVWMIP